MSEERFEEGLAIRREVLGPEYVDAALERATPFARPLQELITEYCWGTVWSRPGLDRRTRSLINLAMLTAMIVAMLCGSSSAGAGPPSSSAPAANTAR